MTIRDGIDWNPLSPANLEDPHPLLRALREAEPVHWAEALHAWLVTRYEEVATVFRDPRFITFKSRVFIEQQLKGQDLGIVKSFSRVMDDMIVTQDGAAHAQRRKQANPSFTSAAIDAFRPRVAAIAEALVEGIARAGRGDVIKDLAEPMPTMVIAELYAIPASDRAMFQAWTLDFLQFIGVAPGDVVARATAANEASKNLEDYLARLIAERRKKPGDDLVSLFVSFQSEGKLTEEALAADLIGFLIGGHSTTIDTIGSGVHTLLTHPDALADVRRDPALIRPAVEEMLRYEPPVVIVIRVAGEDVELAGETIRKGQMVFTSPAAANRDPAVFPDPDRFDIHRPNANKHLAFGVGSHVCLGNSLARRELEIAFSTLVRRIPNLRLDEENPPRRRATQLMMRGFTSLPVLGSPDL